MERLFVQQMVSIRSHEPALALGIATMMPAPTHAWPAASKAARTAGACRRHHRRFLQLCCALLVRSSPLLLHSLSAVSRRTGLLRCQLAAWAQGGLLFSGGRCLHHAWQERAARRPLPCRRRRRCQVFARVQRCHVSAAVLPEQVGKRLRPAVRRSIAAAGSAHPASAGRARAAAGGRLCDLVAGRRRRRRLRSECCAMPRGAAVQAGACDCSAPEVRQRFAHAKPKARILAVHAH